MDEFNLKINKAIGLVYTVNQGYALPTPAMLQ